MRWQCESDRDQRAHHVLHCGGDGCEWDNRVGCCDAAGDRRFSGLGDGGQHGVHEWYDREWHDGCGRSRERDERHSSSQR
jgi:hypothetical protein